MKVYIYISLIIATIAIVIGCKTNTEQPVPMQATMISNYSATSKLFDYVWDPIAFSAPKNKAKIKQYLSILQNNLHSSNLIKELPKNDPAMSITLEWFRDLIDDASTRFNSGNTDYASWKLRSMTSACIACHSRSETQKNFIGDSAMPSGNSVEYKFAAAQFLLATRQFEKASNGFYQLASSLLELESGRNYALEVIKEWLVVEIRVLDRPAVSKLNLEKLLNTISSEDPRMALLFENWINDLGLLAKSGEIKPGEEVDRAKELLKDTMTDSEFSDDEHLVKTLKASAILHSYLDSDSASKNNKSATFLLAIAYQHIPIDSLSIYKELYLEKCIRLFPGTDEAKQSFIIYKELIESENTGSGGLHLEPDQLDKLKLLKEIANTPKVVKS